MKKIIISKKGGFIEFGILLFFRVAWVIIFMFVLRAQINMLNTTELEYHSTEAFLVKYALLHSKTGISYYDADIDRVYPKLIDNRLFDEMEDMLMKSFDYKENKIAVKFNFYKEGNLLKELYLNKKCYDSWDILVITGAKGPGAASKFKFKEKVKYINDFTRNGYVEMEIITSHTPKGAC